MIGIRDFARACVRLSDDCANVLVAENMEDMYWTIPRPEVLQSFKWSIGKIGANRGHGLTYFAIHKGGDMVLDRLGKGPEELVWNSQ